MKNPLLVCTVLLAGIMGPGTGYGEGISAFGGPTLVQIYNTTDLKAIAMEEGRRVFSAECAGCHGADAAGTPGVPDLTTGIWLWGGSLSDIEVTVRYGIRSAHELRRFSEMPAYLGSDLLTEADINDLTEYVLAISGQDAEKEAVTRAGEKFEAFCSECHDYDGKGLKEYFGAPDLTDFDWIYGNDREAIYASIAHGRLGVSPAYDGKLDNDAIKAVTIYVYSLSHY